jgi:phosphoribosylanthranilate isomerase
MSVRVNQWLNKSAKIGEICGLSCSGVLPWKMLEYPMRVKICGITNEADAAAAIEAGADALGFILYPKSPRYVEPKKITAITAQLPPFVQRVAVTVDCNRAEIVAIEAQTSFDLWQLHGEETPAQCATLGKRRLIKALRLTSGQLPDITNYAVSAFLLDTPTANYGGSGKPFDWNLAVQFKKMTSRPIILSGGLTPENVAEAVRIVQPYGVDVSSGVESSPGKKDHAKLKDFIQICKSLKPA